MLNKWIEFLERQGACIRTWWWSSLIGEIDSGCSDNTEVTNGTAWIVRSFNIFLLSSLRLLFSRRAFMDVAYDNR